MKEPAVAISRDGSSAVLVLEVEKPEHSPDGKRVFFCQVRIRLEPRGLECWVRIDLSWEWEEQCDPSHFVNLGFPYFRELSREQALEEFALIAIGGYLEKKSITPAEANKFAAFISLADQLAELSGKAAASDPEITRYWAAKLFQASKHRIELPRLRASDLFRLKTDFGDFMTVIDRYCPEYWEPHAHDGRFRYTPEFLRDFERGALAFARPLLPVFQAQQVLTGPRFEVARRHFEKALEAMEDEPPNLVEACREAILAVESVAKVVTGLEKGTLGDCIKELRGKGILRSPLDRVLEAISGFRGSAPGVMHTGGLKSKLSEEELHYVINLSAASIIFLVSLVPA